MNMRSNSVIIYGRNNFNMKSKKNKVDFQKKYGAAKRNFSGWILLVPTLFLLIFVTLRPMFMGIINSFYELVGFTPTRFIGFENYTQVLRDTKFIGTLFNTVKYVFWSLIIGLPLPFICSIILNEMVAGRNFVRISTYMPAVIPAVAVSLIWTNMYMEGPGGLLNMFLSIFGVAPQQWLMNKSLTIPLIIISMTWQGFGSTMLYYFATLQSVNVELFDAARIDGAGVFSRAKNIIMPHMMPLLILMAIRQIIAVFQVIDQPLVMTGGGPNGASMSLSLLGYQYAFQFSQVGKSLAVNVITFLMLIGLTFVYFGTEKKLAK